MMITKPVKVRIRRTYHSGLSLQYVISPNLMQFHAKLNSIQVTSNSFIMFSVLLRSIIFVHAPSFDHICTSTDARE